MNHGPRRGSAVADALALLGVDELALAIHDGALPMAPEEDVGCGSPGSDEAGRFFRFARGLGFSALQLGPQGETSAGNASPYDASWFSRSTVSLAWAPLLRGERGPRLLDEAQLAAWVAARPPGGEFRVRHREVHASQQCALAEVHARWRSRLARGDADPEAAALREIGARFSAFRRRHPFWLDRYGLFEAVVNEHGSDDPDGWRESGEAGLDRRLFAPRPGEVAAARAREASLRARHADVIERHAFGQLLAFEQHAAVRACAHEVGLRLLGDLQIGASTRDAWSWPHVFLPGHRLGAPPSRTNPEGQPWNYPTLHPGQYGAAQDPDERRESPLALELFCARLAHLLADFDGLRIDHPHGLCDPWVYREGDADPLRAVQSGARLFAASTLPAHPDLARLAIARPDDLNPDPRTAPWDDDWVVRLSAEQVERYAVLFDALMRIARERGRGLADVACEVLSTLPFPLARVLERHGLGRFRVTQKADLVDPHDVYRSENARPEDWIMVGTHDTRPIWRLVEEWRRDGSAAARAQRLARLLARDERDRAELGDVLARDPNLLALACFAELFVSPARRVLVFFTDLFGYEETYNVPGRVSPDNWSLRLPASWRRDFAARLGGGRALNLPRALALALRARHGGAASPGLLGALEAEALAAPAQVGRA